MTTYVSFLSTLQGFAKGLINPAQSDRFAFNCRRSRVFPPNNGIPGYVSQMNDFQPHYANSTVLDVGDLHPTTLALWQKLKPILERAEVEGRITWARDESGETLYEIDALHENTPDAVRFPTQT